MIDSIETLQESLRVFAQERDWEQFHSPKNLAMALIAEAGELVEQFQWLSEQESHKVSGDKHQAVKEELADVFIYLVRLADKLDVDLLQAADEKIKINVAKYPADKVKGKHTKYTEYD